MYCQNCRKQITSIATECPYCHKKVIQNNPNPYKTEISNKQHSYKTTTNSTPSTTYTQNYQQIYDEYSKKLIHAGSTSSISKMADICNEGVMKMAQYMYSAHGTDGQYATYENCAGKLYDVYINNCR